MKTVIRKAANFAICSIACILQISPAMALPGLQGFNNSPNAEHTYQPPVYSPTGPAAQNGSISFHDYISTHPKMRSATIGAGVGTAAGAVTGLLTGRGMLRGAVIGAGTGAGTGFVHSSQIMQRHPIVNNIATGSMLGWGLGMTGGRYGGTTARTTAVGAAGGLATGLLLHGI
jgi:hypothetical protein